MSTSEMNASKDIIDVNSISSNCLLVTLTTAIIGDGKMDANITSKINSDYKTTDLPIKVKKSWFSNIEEYKSIEAIRRDKTWRY